MVYRYRGEQKGSDAGVGAKQRILDAAIELYGEHGFGGVTLKHIAEQAGVSAPLVVHHFGSTSGLRTACDRAAAQRVHESKTMAVAMGEQFSFETMLRQSAKNRSLLRYLTQALMTGGQEVDALMDQLVEDAVAYTTDAVEQGLVTPSTDEYRRSAMLLLQGLGSMMLHGQMKRLIGTSPMDDPPEMWGPYLSTIFEIYTHGIFQPGVYDHIAQEVSENGHSTDSADHPAPTTTPQTPDPHYCPSCETHWNRHRKERSDR